MLSAAGCRLTAGSTPPRARTSPPCLEHGITGYCADARFPPRAAGPPHGARLQPWPRFDGRPDRRAVAQRDRRAREPVAGADQGVARTTAARRDRAQSVGARHRRRRARTARSATARRRSGPRAAAARRRAPARRGTEVEAAGARLPAQTSGGERGPAPHGSAAAAPPPLPHVAATETPARGADQRRLQDRPAQRAVLLAHRRARMEARAAPPE